MYQAASALPAHPCAGLAGQGLRLGIITERSGSNPHFMGCYEPFYQRKLFTGNILFYSEQGGFAFQSQTSCLLLPGPPDYARASVFSKKSGTA
jgi:hypothetical protein